MTTRISRCAEFNNKVVVEWFDNIIPHLPTDITKTNIKLIWEKISSHRHLSLPVLDKYRDKPWDWNRITETLSYKSIMNILNRPDLPWNYYYIALCKVTPDILIKYAHLPFDICSIANYYPELLTNEVFYLYRNKFTDAELSKIYKKIPRLVAYDMAKMNKIISNKGNNANNIPDSIKIDYKQFSSHESYTLDFVLANNNEQWDRTALAYNPNIKLNGFDLHKLKLPGKILSYRKDISIDIINSNPKIKWEWDSLTARAIRENMITKDDILNNPHKPWDWWYMRTVFESDPNFENELVQKTIEFIETNHSNKVYCNGQTMPTLCKVRGMYKCYYIIKKYIDKPWDWDYISNNYILTLDDIISSNGKIILSKIDVHTITIDIINAFPEHKWDYCRMTDNENIPIDLIISKCEASDSFWAIYMSFSPRITEQILDKYCDKPWDWARLSKNLKITTNMVINNIHKPWDWDELTRNSRDVKIFYDGFEEHINANMTQYMAAYRIQQWWIRISSDPRHPVGRRRLERAYERDFGE